MVDTMFSSAYAELISVLVDMRKQAGLTQRQLADALGREQNFVGRIETSQRRVDLVEVIQICKACGIDPEAGVGDLVARIASRVPRKRPRR